MKKRRMVQNHKEWTSMRFAFACAHNQHHNDLMNPISIVKIPPNQFSQARSCVHTTKQRIKHLQLHDIEMVKIIASEWWSFWALKINVTMYQSLSYAAH